MSVPDKIPLVSRIVIWDALVLILLVLTFLNPQAFAGHYDYLESSMQLGVISELLQGRIAYRDTYLLFGPLTYMLPTLVMSIWGAEAIYLRLVLLLGWVGVFFSLYLILRLFYRERAFAVLTFGLIFLMMFPRGAAAFWGGHRYIFSYASMLMALETLQSGGRIRPLLTGIFVGLAFLFSPDQGIVLAALYLPAFLFRIRHDSVFWRESALVIAGVLIPLMCFAAWLVSNQIVSPFIDDLLNMQFKRYWIQASSWEAISGRLLIPLFSLVFLAVCSQRAPLSVQQKSIGVYWLSSCVVLSFHGLRAPEWHQGAMADGMAVFAALWGGSVAGLRIVMPVLMLRTAAALVLTAWSCFGLGTYSLLNSAENFRVQYPVTEPLQVPRVARFQGISVFQSEADDIEQTVSAINQHLASDDELLIYPADTLFYFLTGRRALTEFSPLELAASMPRAREAVIRKVISKMPKMAIIEQAPYVISRSVGKSEVLIPEITDFVDKHYFKISETRFRTIYLRKDFR